MDNYKVYVHINKINGKLYFGQTGQENVKDRWDSGHGYKPCVAFNRAIEKYGWDNFEHIVLFENLSLEMANIIESELIKKYETTNGVYGYNITSGGSNYKMSERTKEKLRMKAVGRTHSDESKEKIRKYLRENHPMQGKHHSEETKKKMRNVKLGKFVSQETRDKLSKVQQGENNPFYGKHHTQETKDIISQKASERNIGEGNPFYGKHHTDEAKRKMSKAHKRIPKEKHPMYGKPMSDKAREAIKQSHIKEVIQLDREEKNIIATYESSIEAGNAIGCSSSAIRKCCTGVNRTCKGYVFKYKEEVMKESG